MTPIRTTRRGATLIELLVVMSIAAALGAMALMLLPSVANSDNTLKGAAEVQSTCKMAQALAGSARLPRGVRFLVQPGGTVCTEMQYLESPPVMVPDRQVLVSKPNDVTPFGAGGSVTGINTKNGPQVWFSYELNKIPANGPVGAVVKRHCYITGLTSDQLAQVTDGAVMSLPVLGAWSRITGVLTAPLTPPPPTALQAAAVGTVIEVILDVYPDAALGVASEYRTYHFGIYGVPVPLLAEPTVPMPKNIGVDLQVSLPAGIAGAHYDILFAPSGQTISTYGTKALNGTVLTTGVTANTGVFLWVRDVTKVTNPNNPAKQFSMYFNPAPVPPATSDILTASDYAKAFRLGGEQQIVGIRNGFVGAAPVLWPDNAGNYTAPQSPVYLARQKLN